MSMEVGAVVRLRDRLWQIDQGRDEEFAATKTTNCEPSGANGLDSCFPAMSQSNYVEPCGKK